MSDLAEAVLAANAWPFQEARALVEKRLAKRGAGNEGGDKGYVLFETGYGPSGLPHIGTFGEVVRTTMVRNALQVLLPNVKTRLFAFSDDMDGLRKAPRQRSQPGDAEAAPRQAAHPDPRSVRHPRELRPPQQRPPARVPG